MTTANVVSLELGVPVLDVDTMEFGIENPVDFLGEDRLTKHSHMWKEDKDKYALLVDEVGCSIFYINGKEHKQN